MERESSVATVPAFEELLKSYSGAVAWAVERDGLHTRLNLVPAAFTRNTRGPFQVHLVLYTAEHPAGIPWISRKTGFDGTFASTSVTCSARCSRTDSRRSRGRGDLAPPGAAHSALQRDVAGLLHERRPDARRAADDSVLRLGQAHARRPKPAVAGPRQDRRHVSLAEHDNPYAEPVISI